MLKITHGQKNNLIHAKHSHRITSQKNNRSVTVLYTDAKLASKFPKKRDNNLVMIADIATVAKDTLTDLYKNTKIPNVISNFVTLFVGTGKHVEKEQLWVNPNFLNEKGEIDESKFPDGFVELFHNTNEKGLKELLNEAEQTNQAEGDYSVVVKPGNTGGLNCSNDLDFVLSYNVKGKDSYVVGFKVDEKSIGFREEYAMQVGRDHPLVLPGASVTLVEVIKEKKEDSVEQEKNPVSATKDIADRILQASKQKAPELPEL